MNDTKKLHEIIETLTQYVTTLSEREKAPAEQVLSRLQTFADEYIDFGMILNGLNEQFYITDAEEKTLFVNRAYCNAAKLEPDQLIGKTITTIVEKDQYFQDPIIPKIIEEKKPLQVIAKVRAQEDPVCLIGTPIFDDDGKLCYAVSNDYRPEDISGLQFRFAQFEQQKELQKKEAELDYYRSHLTANKNYHFADPVMMQIIDLIKSIGSTDVTVLITGETGTGKEVIADLLYQNSTRREQPFIKVNCAAIPENLLESELFGYEKGAFTGANKNGKIGMMELADKGTLLLDEIGDIPLALQTKLLRALQEKEIRRVGGTKDIAIDIRIIASTNKNLQKEVENGRFREDLYYRLNVIPIQIPALRERPDDVLLLTQRFLEQYNARYRKTVRLEDDAVRSLQKYTWPGNIRELKNILERLVVTNQSGRIEKMQVENALGLLSGQPVEPSVSSPDPTAIQDLNLKKAKSHLETEYIKAALKQYPSKRQAAKALGIDHSTLIVKCQKYNL